MKDITLKERADLYRKAFPNWPPPKVNEEDGIRVDDRWIDGVWILGQDYRGSGYYGSYPPNYLNRVMSMFPDSERILHLFAGSLPKGNYTRFDLKPEMADVAGDAHLLSSYFKWPCFDLILADPPYSAEDCEHYGTTMINRNTVLRHCELLLEPGGYLIWLDQVLPMFRKDQFSLCGAIGIVRSTNHRFRVAAIFRKLVRPSS